MSRVVRLAQRVDDRRGGLRCELLTPDELAGRGPAGVLCEIRFNAGTEAHVVPPNTRHPVLTVPLRSLGNEPYVEIWTADEPAHYERRGPFHCAIAGEIMAGVYAPVSVPGGLIPGGSMSTESMAGQAVPVEHETRELYRSLLSLLPASDHPALLRVWNHLRDINAEEGHLERYRAFCRGRHDALIERDPEFELHLPAASAVGAHAGGLAFYFISSRTPGQVCENPRQMHAYRYPAQYGPRSPSFARAMLKRSGKDGAQLYVSGTASIVGHETRHPHLLAAQLEETIHNLSVLIDTAATQEGVAFDGLRSFECVKIYVRHATDTDLVRARLKQALAPDCRVLYLEADICRSDLMIEIEGVAGSKGQHAGLSAR